MEVLSDIFFNSTFGEEEMKKEKGVVQEEILQCEDDPSDLCHVLLSKAYFGDAGLGRPVLGTEQTVASFTREQILEYISGHYRAERTVVSIAGNIEEDRAIELVKKYFGGAKFKNGAEPKEVKRKINDSSNYAFKIKPIEQANLAIGYPAYKYNDQMSIAASLASNILGGGMSSRLFQVLREELGIVYEVYSTLSEYKDCGKLIIYLGTNPATLDKAVKAVKDILHSLKKDGITQKEFLKGKEQLKTGLVLGAEKSYSIMRAAAVKALMANEEFNIDKTLSKINAVKLEDVNLAIRHMLNDEKACAGYVGKEKFSWA
jgi:predicted Zn-dependent peptidase